MYLGSAWRAQARVGPAKGIPRCKVCVLVLTNELGFLKKVYHSGYPDLRATRMRYYSGLEKRHMSRVH